MESGGILMRKWMLMAAAAILLGAVVLSLLLNLQNGGEAISAEEAREKVAGMYGGEAEAAASSGEAYEIAFVRGDGRYKAVVDKQSGQVDSVELEEKFETAKKLTETEASAIATKEVGGEVEEIVYAKDSNAYRIEISDGEKRSTVLVSADTGEIEKIPNEAEAAAPPAEPERVITEDEAIEIAKKTLDGEVGEVEFVESEDGGFYLVDIENETTEQEVLVQIHAIRGETMTVEWDD
jgi:uncharacterized membrane protein YkoI